MTQDELDNVKGREEHLESDQHPKGIGDEQSGDIAPDTGSTHVPYDTESLQLFKTVFSTAQKPDEGNVKFQQRMAVTFTVILAIQVLWSMVMITNIICNNNSMSTNALTFIALLVTAILAEVVAMAFVVVRFVFRTPWIRYSCYPALPSRLLISYVGWCW